MTYLLDTSALRGLGAAILQKHTFYTSPYCFWELLTHLDEGEFAYRKNQLMKVRFTRVLDDPRADIEAPLLIHDTQLQERVSDEELITYTLAALQDSESLERLYLALIKDSKGNLRDVADVAARARKELEEREQRYIGFVQQIINALQHGQLKIGNDEEYHGAILSLLEGDVIKLKQRGAIDKSLRERLINNYYIYWSYIVHRALDYFKRGKTKIMANDFEDGEICKHLALDTSYCLVTADKGQKEVLERTISLVNRRNETQFYTTLHVIDLNRFCRDS